MRKLKIVTDSSADLVELPGADFAVAPLRIVTDGREFTDDKSLDVDEMINYMSRYKGKSASACPGVGQWLEAFDGADDVICITLTGGISGSHNAAVCAGEMYREENEGARVFVFDTLSAGPEVTMIVQKAAELAANGTDFDGICSALREYKKNTGLTFMLKSLATFANNGRVSPVVAKIAGLAGICIVGRASDEGTLQPTDKCMGETRSIAKIAERLKEAGLSKGRVLISHCRNLDGAKALRELIKKQFPNARTDIITTRGLCSYYAENGGLLVGFEKI